MKRLLLPSTAFVRSARRFAHKQPQAVSELELALELLAADAFFREAGRTPVQRNTFYEPIKVLADCAPSANEAEPPSNKSKVLEDNLATA